MTQWTTVVELLVLSTIRARQLFNVASGYIKLVLSVSSFSAQLLH